MKTNRILRIVLALLVMALATEVAFRLNLWNIRGVQASDVYYRYKNTPGVNAAYIKDYRVNDTLTVCATLLEAVDSASWAEMRSDFGQKDTNAMIMNLIKSGILKKNVRLAPKRNYLMPTDTVLTNNDMIVTTHKSHTICIFHLESREQYDAIYKKQFDEMNPKF